MLAYAVALACCEGAGATCAVGLPDSSCYLLQEALGPEHVGDSVAWGDGGGAMLLCGASKPLGAVRCYSAEQVSPGIR
jgi:hypothetical protein